MPRDLSALPPPVPVHGTHHLAWRCRNAGETRHCHEDLLGLPLVHLSRADHHIEKSIYFFDPDGPRLALTVPTAPEAEMQRLAPRAHAELAAWTAR